MIFDAVVLAGGRSSRLGGHPKPQLIFEGSTLLERTLHAVQDARQIVIVGDPGATAVPPTTIVTREDPQFGGPAAAIAAGLSAVTGAAADWVLVLACDMPGVGLAVPVLLSTRAVDGVVALDDDRREQYLLARYRRAALSEALGALDRPVSGMSVRTLIAGLAVTLVDVPSGSSADVDTWDDAAQLGIPTTPEGAA